jgi:hypothetical protein
VHLAEVGTTLTAGASHWRFGNVGTAAAEPELAPTGH